MQQERRAPQPPMPPQQAGANANAANAQQPMTVPGTIRFRTSLRNTILDVLRSRGWKETDSETEWDFHWADVGWIRDVAPHIRLEENQKICHFKNHIELTRKDYTIKNLKRMKKALEKEEQLEEAARFDFFPATYSLPQDYGIFEVEYKRNPTAIWIMKPPAKAQGKGIFLFTKIQQISDWRKYKLTDKDKDGQALVEPYLVQRYIDNPHLVGGKKYDLRIYALVTSFSPLIVWLNRTGFARFCHHRYTLKDIEQTFVHVTNVAVQKTNPKYTSQSGCKWGLRSLRQYFMTTVGETATNCVFGEIQWLILRTLQAVQKVMMQDKHCFELYGYDILIDETLKPILMEVNASPSLTAETPADYHLKFNLLDDMLTIVDMEKKLTGNEDRIGGFDLIWRGGPYGPALIDPSAGSGLSCMLGCANEHEIPISKIKMPPKLANLGSDRPLT